MSRKKSSSKAAEAAEGILAGLREIREIVEKGEDPVKHIRKHHPERVRTYTFHDPGRHTPVMVRKLRAQLGMSQAIFARMIGVSAILVQSWERGVREPSTMARRLLDTISRDPAAWVSSVVERKAG